MRWTSEHKIVPFAHGDVRTVKRFAWRKTFIDGKFVWLERYEMLQLYEVSEKKLIIEGEKLIFSVGKWLDIAKRCS